MTPRYRGFLGTLAVVLVATPAVVFRSAPEPTRSAGTARAAVAGPKLRLTIVDATTGKPTPARFSLRVNGKPFYPVKLNSHGLRFVSIHEAKKQTYVVTYSRGTGIVEVALPHNARTVEVAAAKQNVRHQRADAVVESQRRRTGRSRPTAGVPGAGSRFTPSWLHRSVCENSSLFGWAKRFPPKSRKGKPAACTAGGFANG